MHQAGKFIPGREPWDDCRLRPDQSERQRHTAVCHARQMARRLAADQRHNETGGQHHRWELRTVRCDPVLPLNACLDHQHPTSAWADPESHPVSPFRAY